MAFGRLEEVLYSHGYEVMHIIHSGESVHSYRVSKDGERYIAKAAIRNEGKSIIRTSENLSRIGIHENIVSVKKTIDDWIMIQEDVLGVDLDKKVAADGKLSEEDAFSVMYKICSGLSAAHSSGILHRDISPSNVVVSPDYSTVKVIDFGSSGSSGRSTSSHFTGGYASPEQLSRSRLDNRSDIYSVGAVLYFLIKGVGPYDSAFDASPLEIASKLNSMQKKVNKLDFRGFSQKARRIILKAMAYDSSCRYQNVEDMMADIEAEEVVNKGFFERLVDRFRSNCIKQENVESDPDMSKFQVKPGMIKEDILGDDERIERELQKTEEEIDHNRERERSEIESMLNLDEKSGKLREETLKKARRFYIAWPQEAYPFYERMWSRFNDYDAGRFTANCLRKMNKTKEASELYEMLLEIKEDPEILNSVGCIKLERGELYPAVAYLHRSAELKNINAAINILNLKRIYPDIDENMEEYLEVLVEEMHENFKGYNLDVERITLASE